jgi:Tfp pilus assembly protein PilF
MRTPFLCSTLACIVIVLLVGCTQSPTQPGERDTRDTRANTGVLSEDARSRYRAALEHASQQQFSKAEQALLRLSREQPRHPGIWLNLASIYYQTDQLEKAQSSVDRAKALEPASAAIYNLKGSLALHSGDVVTAEHHYRRALKYDTQAAEVYYNLGLLYDTYYQDIATAISYYQAYLELNPATDQQTAQWVEQLKLSLEN